MDISIRNALPPTNPAEARRPTDVRYKQSAVPASPPAGSASWGIAAAHEFALRDQYAPQNTRSTGARGAGCRSAWPILNPFFGLLRVVLHAHAPDEFFRTDGADVGGEPLGAPPRRGVEALAALWGRLL